MALPTYQTGTVSVSADGTVVTGLGTIWTGINVVAGDMLAIDGAAPVLITDVADVTHLSIPAWAGADKAGVAYIIYQVSSLRFDDVQIAQDLQKQVQALNATGYIIPVPVGGTPDPSLGDDGQWATIPESNTWWRKSGGVWVASGAPVAGYGGASSTSLAIGTGSKAFTTQAGLAYQVGARVRASSAADGTNYMEGLVSAYSGTSLTIAVTTVGGSGTKNDWNLNIAGQPGAGDMSKSQNLAGLTDVAAARANLGVRNVLTANRTYYVRKDGSDSNNGLADTSGGAFLTIDAASVAAAKLDISVFDVTIQVRTGTYAESVQLRKPVGAGKVNFIGDQATPGNVIVANAGNPFSAGAAAAGGQFSISGFRVASSTAQDIAVSAGSVTTSYMEYAGSSANYRLYVNSFGTLTCSGTSHKVLSGGLGLFLVEMFGKLYLNSSKFTFGANVTYSGATITSRQIGYCEATGATFDLGAYTVTGSRYAVSNSAGILGTGSVNFFPGTSAGTNSGGFYG